VLRREVVGGRATGTGEGRRGCRAHHYAPEPDSSPSADILEPAVVEFSVRSEPLASAAVDLLVVTATRTGDDTPPALGAGGAELADALGFDLVAQLDALGVDGSVGSVGRIAAGAALPAASVLAVGLGDGTDLDAFRRAGAAIAAATERLVTAAVALPEVGGADAVAVAQALAEGTVLGAHRFGRYKREGATHALERLEVVTDADVADALRVGATTAGAACLARDLVNTPPGDKRPSMLAARAEEELAGTGVDVRVLDGDALRAGGYGGLLGVCAGSSEDPRLVELTYAPEGATRHVCLVGKGITFDSGGLSLKPPASMETMKMDMGGAATVLATVKAAAALGLPVRVTGLMALAENMPSGTATRPGDVLTIRGGGTVEVLNTDAEGRLVLADALVHAGELDPRPDVIVDMATLTGAVLVALGERIGAVMSDEDDLVDALVTAGAAAGEPLWRLPLAAQYRRKLDSDVADIKNVGGKNAGTVTAGLFLQHFAPDDIPWAHLDIAGMAWSDDEDGYLRKGGTGAPVRALVEWLRRG
jgi:leucyl aminopeptidase